MRDTYIHRMRGQAVEVNLTNGYSSRGILVFRTDKGYRLETEDGVSDDFTHEDVEFIERLTRPEIVLDDGGCLVVDTNDCRVFEIHNNSYDFRGRVVVREIENNQILYDEKRGSIPYHRNLIDLEKDDLFIWHQQPSYVHRITGKLIRTAKSWQSQYSTCQMPTGCY